VTRELLVTTGHNSSAILLEDGIVQWGYETERLTGVKSDSRWPLEHLERWGQSVGKVDVAYVTHWAPDGQLSSMSAKHYDPLPHLEGVPIVSLSADPADGRTHHDTHAHAALAYAGQNFPREGAYCLVVDGFGVCGEHFSAYSLSSGQPELVKRVHGYDTSLGLWYQYATAFLGLKMHEDEYKLLGYEAYVAPELWPRVQKLALHTSFEWLDAMSKSVFGSAYDPLYSTEALPKTKELVFKRLLWAARELGVEDSTSFEGRAILACYVQAVLEKVVLSVVGDLKPKHLLVSGGVFYNVKLNLKLLKSIEGKFCAYPLAGDQGNALGLYAKLHPQWRFPSDLFWGKRVLRDVQGVPNLFVGDEVEVLSAVKRQLRSVGFVNLVRGDMEFGPRALCNTSTLALPTKANVERINAMNDRNTVMPMAPVMTSSRYLELFEDTKRVWRSQQHMIVAMEYAEHPLPEMMGVAHGYERPNRHHTGRPQVVGDDPFMTSLLDEFGGVLINTSFNYHGRPIALGTDSIVSNHMAMLDREPSVVTTVVRSDN